MSKTKSNGTNGEKSELTKAETSRLDAIATEASAIFDNVVSATMALGRKLQEARDIFGTLAVGSVGAGNPYSEWREAKLPQLPAHKASKALRAADWERRLNRLGKGDVAMTENLAAKLQQWQNAIPGDTETKVATIDRSLKATKAENITSGMAESKAKKARGNRHNDTKDPGSKSGDLRKRVADAVAFLANVEDADAFTTCTDEDLGVLFNTLANVTKARQTVKAA
jgi:hypothetical protein